MSKNLFYHTNSHNYLHFQHRRGNYMYFKEKWMVEHHTPIIHFLHSSVLKKRRDVLPQTPRRFFKTPPSLFYGTPSFKKRRCSFECRKCKQGVGTSYIRKGLNDKKLNLWCRKCMYFH